LRIRNNHEYLSELTSGRTYSVSPSIQRRSCRLLPNYGHVIVTHLLGHNIFLGVVDSRSICLFFHTDAVGFAAASRSGF